VHRGAGSCAQVGNALVLLLLLPLLLLLSPVLLCWVVNVGVLSGEHHACRSAVCSMLLPWLFVVSGSIRKQG
jgi:hypothetical protein